MKNFKTLYILIPLVWLGFVNSQAQPLRRKGFLGMKFNPHKLYNAKGSKGLLIQSVPQNSTAAQLKIKANDVLIAINDTPIQNFKTLIAAWKPLYQGDRVTFKIYRDHKVRKFKGKVVGKPKQLSTRQTKVIYDQVTFRQGRLRVIVSHPRGSDHKKHPAIMMIPGYTCASLDNLSAKHPYRKMFDAWEQKGYVVFRVEKPGVGDCDGTRGCREIDFKTEIEAFAAGYQKLQSYDFVDQDNIFIFGHSMGGIIAPLLAEKFQPKGVIVYGTLYSTWFEYCLRMFRFQNPHMGVSFEENEKDMRIYPDFLRQYLIQKKSPQELAQNAHFKKLLERDHQYKGGDWIFDRHYSYWQGVQDVYLTKAWKNTTSYVLSVFGEADFEALDPTDHRRIVEIVNHYHPGKATYAQLAKTSHGLMLVGTMNEWLERKRKHNFKGIKFNKKIIDITDEWIQSVILKQQE